MRPSSFRLAPVNNHSCPTHLHLSPLSQLIAVSATEAIKDETTANLDRAKQWYEAALALLPFSSWGDVKAGKLRSRYGELLERMQRGA